MKIPFILLTAIVAICCIAPASGYTAGFSPYGDGYAQRSAFNSTITSIHTDAGNGADATATSFAVILETWAGTIENNFSVSKVGIIQFDTSSLPDSSVISAADLNITIFQNYTNLGPYSIVVTSGYLGTNGTVVASDYNRNGTTEYSARIPWTSIASLTAKTIPLNAAGIAAIKKSGNTTFFIQIADLFDDEFRGEWAADSESGITIRSNEHATVAYRPRLNVTYTIPKPSIYPRPYVNDSHILPTDDTHLPAAGLNVSINATPGEITMATFIIKPPIDTTNMTVNVTDFVDGSGNKILNSSIDLKLLAVWHQSRNNRTYATYDDAVISTATGKGTTWTMTPELVLNNLSILSIDTLNQRQSLFVQNATFSGFVHIDNTSQGQWMDDYKIFDNATAEGFPQPFRLNTSINQEVVVTAQVPTGTPFGNYTGWFFVNSSETDPQQVNGTIRVLPWTLPNNTIVHSMYGTSPMSPTNIQPVDQAFYTIEMQDVKDHGVLHPMLEEPTAGWTTQLETMMDVRDSLDFPKDKLFTRGYNFVWTANNQTNSRIASIVSHVNNLTQAANTTHGYVDVYYYGEDEAPPTYYSSENVTFQNITAVSGAKVYLSGYSEPNLVSKNVDVMTIVGRNYTLLASAKAQGLDVYQYSIPQAQVDGYPGTTRKNYGLGLIKYGYAGAMQYRYTTRLTLINGSLETYSDIRNTSWNEYYKSQGTLGGWMKPGGYVYYKADGVVDTIQWELYREGVNDQRYAQKLEALTGSNATSLAIINAGIAAGTDPAIIRNNLIDAILTEMGTAPVADFSANATAVCQGDYVAFTDISTYSPDTWLWEFGDGNTSTSQNPTFRYNVLGSMTVNLTANNTAGLDYINKTGYITVSDCKPIVDFTSNVTSGTQPMGVQFNDTSAVKTPLYWNWSFGDGSWSNQTSVTAANVTKTYSTGSTYTVALSITNATGTNTTSKSGYMTVYNRTTSNIASNVTSGTVPFAVQFNETSVNGSAYQWFFGDGNSSIVKNASFTYTVPGNYSVNHSVYNGFSYTNWTNASYYINASSGIAPAKSWSNFTADATTVSLGTEVAFYDTSNNTPNYWEWDFGDGNTTGSLLQNPTHLYTATGIYPVSLNASNVYGFGGNITKADYISVISAISFVQQDLWMAGEYVITWHVTDSTTGVSIPNVTISDSNGHTTTTINGTGSLTEPFGTAAVTFSAAGYSSKTVTYVFDQSIEYDVQLTPAGAGSTDINLQGTPKDVKFHITSFWGAPIANANVTIQGISTTTGSWDWVATLLSIDLEETPIQNTLMSGLTDTNGDAVFLMLASLKYNITISKAGYTFPLTYISPQASTYTISANMNESWFSSGNDTLKEVNVSVSWVPHNATHAFVNITYQDDTGTTTGGDVKVYQRSAGRAVNAPPVAVMNVTASSCSNSTAVEVPTGGASYVVDVNATTSTGTNIKRTFAHDFKGQPVNLPGFTPETQLWLAMFILIFTAAFAGVLHAPQISIVLCVELWAFWAIRWFDHLIDGNGYTEAVLLVMFTLATFAAFVWNITEGKSKGKRSS